MFGPSDDSGVSFESASWVREIRNHWSLKIEGHCVISSFRHQLALLLVDFLYSSLLLIQIMPRYYPVKLKLNDWTLKLKI